MEIILSNIFVGVLTNPLFWVMMNSDRNSRSGEKKMTYTVASEPKIQSEYSDNYETVLTINVRRDGVTGEVWICAGVPEYLRGSSDAARSQDGYTDVWAFGDSVDTWLDPTLQVSDEDGSYQTVQDEILAAVKSAAMDAHYATVTA